MTHRLPPATKTLLVITLAVFALQYLLGDVRMASFMLWPLGGGVWALVVHALAVAELRLFARQLFSFVLQYAGAVHVWCVAGAGLGE